MHRDHLFGQLFEESSDPAFIVDPAGDQILAANHAGCALLGYTRQELLATPVSRIHPADLPQLREFVNGVLEHARRIPRSSSPAGRNREPSSPSRWHCSRSAAPATPASSGSCTTAANTGSPSPAD